MEALRVIRLTRKTAVEARTKALQLLRSQIVSAPDELRNQVRSLTRMQLIRTCAASRPDPGGFRNPVGATGLSLRSLARRIIELNDEIGMLDELIAQLVQHINPRLTKLVGIGTENAAQLLVTVGDNPDRLRSEGAFAMLCGAAPLPASSGQTTRHRLNRAGDRAANSALHMIAISRLRLDPRAKAYAERRTQEGRTKREIIRCLKRYIAREVYASLRASPDTT